MITYSKWNTLLVLIGCLLVAPFRGKAKQVPNKVEKVLTVYLTGNVGDMVFGTPVFRSLKEHILDAKMVVIGRKHNKETLGYNTDIDEYVVCPNSVLELYKEIKKIDADYAFTFTQSFIELGLMYIAGIPAIVTFESENSNTQTFGFRILKKFLLLEMYNPSLNVAHENHKLLAPLGIENTSTEKYLAFSDEANTEIDSFYKENGVEPKDDFVIAIAPGAGTKIKQWPAERFAMLADHLATKYQTPIFVVGGPGDKQEYEDTLAAVGKETQLISCLHHSIDELKAFLSKIDIIVANDSAPIYVAEAFGKSTVTIVGPTDENEHPPKGAKHRTVKADVGNTRALKSKLSKEYEYNEEVAREQICKVTTELVVETTDELIGYIKNNSI